MKEIQLTQNNVALVDDQDFEYLSQWKWFAHKRKNTWWYARRSSIRINGAQKTVHMHRLIMGVTDSLIFVDHKNHDGLDNRRDNLRLCTRQENHCNRRAFKGGSSEYLGVSKFTQKCNGKLYWHATLTHNRKQKHLGYFPFTPEGELQAADAYNNAAKQSHGEFVNLNHSSKT